MSVRDKKILLVFFGILVLVAAFFFGYRPLNEKKATLEAENVSLRDTYADLSMKAANADMYNKEIKMMNTKMEEIYTHYPSFLQTENQIMDAVAFEDVTDADISALTISEPVAKEITADGQSEDANGQSEDANGQVTEGDVSNIPYQLYDVNTTMSFECGYKGFKKMIQVITNDSQRKSIGTVSAVFNNTDGTIQGNMTYDTYFIYGLDKSYVEPSTPEIKHGTNNIFGTVDTVQ